MSQLSSSLPSPQSLSPSQMDDNWTHRPLSQYIWLTPLHTVHQYAINYLHVHVDVKTRRISTRCRHQLRPSTVYIIFSLDQKFFAEPSVLDSVPRDVRRMDLIELKLCQTSKNVFGLILSIFWPRMSGFCYCLVTFWSLCTTELFSLTWLRTNVHKQFANFQISKKMWVVETESTQGRLKFFSKTNNCIDKSGAFHNTDLYEADAICCSM